MTFSNSLSPIYDSFEVARECFKVARRTIDSQIAELIHRTPFVGATPQAAASAIDGAAAPETTFAVLTAVIDQIRAAHIPEVEEAVD